MGGGAGGGRLRGRGAAGPRGHAHQRAGVRRRLAQVGMARGLQRERRARRERAVRPQPRRAVEPQALPRSLPAGPGAGERELHAVDDARQPGAPGRPARRDDRADPDQHAGRDLHATDHGRRPRSFRASRRRPSGATDPPAATGPAAAAPRTRSRSGRCGTRRTTRPTGTRRAQPSRGAAQLRPHEPPHRRLERAHPDGGPRVPVQPGPHEDGGQLVPAADDRRRRSEQLRCGGRPRVRLGPEPWREHADPGHREHAEDVRGQHGRRAPPTGVGQRIRAPDEPRRPGHSRR